MTANGWGRAGWLALWVAFAGGLWLAVATVGASQLGRPASGIDAEGPGLARRLAKIGGDLALARANIKAGPMEPAASIEESTRVRVHRLRAEEAAAEQAAADLLASSEAGATALHVLAMRKGFATSVIGAGDIAGFNVLGGGLTLPKDSTPVRVEADTAGGGGVIWIAALPEGRGRGTHWAMVFYEGVMLINPEWQPLRRQALHAGIATALLAFGLGGWWWARRRRRWALAEPDGATDAPPAAL